MSATSTLNRGKQGKSDTDAEVKRLRAGEKKNTGEKEERHYVEPRRATVKLQEGGKKVVAERALRRRRGALTSWRAPGPRYARQ